jgi:hypothetical protein
MLTRQLTRPYGASNTVPHITNQSLWDRLELIRASAIGVHLPRGNEPMMDTGHGRVIPAAQDPTDPATWRVPVVFT